MADCAHGHETLEVEVLQGHKRTEMIFGTKSPWRLLLQTTG